MGGGNGQKSKMAREKNMEKLKASSKGEKSARSKQESNVYSVQGMHANLYLHHV
ncbi:hypothetical protein IC582_018215 [Cucumis melo]